MGKKLDRFVKGYVKKHPEILPDILNELHGVPYRTDGEEKVALPPDQFDKLMSSGIVEEEGLELNIPEDECRRMPWAEVVGGACLIRYFKRPGDPNSVEVKKLKIRED